MKHFVATLGILTAIALMVGLISYRANGSTAVKAALAKQDAMAWLRADFQLTDAQFTAIKRLHDAYSLVCAEHCRAIQDAAQLRDELKASSKADVASLAEADRRVEELQAVCESAITSHVRQCADLMTPEAGRRYLALVLPKIEDFDHAAPPDLLLSHGHH